MTKIDAAIIRTDLTMKLGFFGGTFDPVHIGHLIIAEWARTALELEKIVFMPAGDPPHKSNSQITPVRHRLAMVELAVADNLHFAVADFEAKKSGKSYTVETLRHLRQQYGDVAQLYWLIGSDSLLDLPNWYQPKEIFRLAQIVVYPRPGFPVKAANPNFRRQTLQLDAPEMNFSANQIRQRVRLGQSIRYLIPPVVAQYIDDNALYR